MLDSTAAFTSMPVDHANNDTTTTILLGNMRPLTGDQGRQVSDSSKPRPFTQVNYHQTMEPKYNK